VCPEQPAHGIGFRAASRNFVMAVTPSTSRPANQALCAPHYHLASQPNNRGVAQENGIVEAPHAPLSNGRLGEQKLLLCAAKLV